MIPQDRLGKLDQIIRQARETGNETVLAEALGLLAQVLRQNAAEGAVSLDGPDPMTRARGGWPAQAPQGARPVHRHPS